MIKKGILSILLGTFVFAAPAGAFARGGLTYQYLERINTPQYAEVGSNFIEIEGQADKERIARWDLYYEGQGRFYTGKGGGFMGSIPEAYIQRNRGNTSITIGRKLLTWSPNQKFWNLGNLNANRGFSLMEEKEEGIMAAHFDRRVGAWDFSFFASALHIPQINPGYKVVDGELKGVNEWSSLPYKEISFNGQRVPIEYELQTPEYQKLLLQESIGAKIGRKVFGVKVWAYGTYKPENQIRVVASGIYDPVKDRAVVKAKPFVNHHLMWGMGSEVKSGKLTVKTGWDVVHPRVGETESPEFQALEIKPTYYKEVYAHTSANWDYDTFDVSVNYLHLVEGKEDASLAFSKKSMWRRAVGISIGYDITENFRLAFKERFDIQLRDSLFQSVLAYRVTKHATVKLGIEVLDSPKSNSFWNPYRTNDTIFSSLGYLF